MEISFVNNAREQTVMQGMSLTRGTRGSVLPTADRATISCTRWMVALLAVPANIAYTNNIITLYIYNETCIYVSVRVARITDDRYIAVI